jgi:small subunit ribosomal protein S4
MPGDTSENLIGLLERRLDALCYRAKFAPTMHAVRQFISHGHVKVNGRKVSVASIRLKVGDVIEVKEKSKELPVLLESLQIAERDVPDYVEADHKRMTAKLTRMPALSDVPYPVQMDPALVVEYYSR